MKTKILKLIISIGKLFLNIIYFFMKLLPSKNRVVMLSRQTDKISIDFQLIEKELKKKNKDVEIKILCKKIKSGINGKIAYCFYILKCMR